MRLALDGELGFMGRGEHSRLRLRQRCSSQEQQRKCRPVSIYLAGTKAAWEEDGRLAGELRSDRKGLTCQAEEFRHHKCRQGMVSTSPKSIDEEASCHAQREHMGERGTVAGPLGLLMFSLNFYGVLY